MWQFSFFFFFCNIVVIVARERSRFVRLDAFEDFGKNLRQRPASVWSILELTDSKIWYFQYEIKVSEKRLSRVIIEKRSFFTEFYINVVKVERI